MGILFGTHQTPAEQIAAARTEVTALANTLKREAARQKRRCEEAAVALDDAQYTQNTSLVRVYLKQREVSARLLAYYLTEEDNIRQALGGLDQQLTQVTMNGVFLRIARAISRVVAHTPAGEFSAIVMRHQANLTDLKMRHEGAKDALALDTDDMAATEDEDVDARVEAMMKEMQSGAALDEMLAEAPNMRTLRAPGKGRAKDTSNNKPLR
jgi:hypothetical protein